MPPRQSCGHAYRRSPQSSLGTVGRQSCALGTTGHPVFTDGSRQGSLDDCFISAASIRPFDPANLVQQVGAMGARHRSQAANRGLASSAVGRSVVTRQAKTAREQQNTFPGSCGGRRRGHEVQDAGVIPLPKLAGSPSRSFLYQRFEDQWSNIAAHGQRGGTLHHQLSIGRSSAQ